MRFAPWRLYDAPVDPLHASTIAEEVRRVRGADTTFTAQWLAQHKTPSALLSAVRDAWQQSDLLRASANAIARVQMLADGENAEFALAVHLDAPRVVWLQQAPIARSRVISSLGRIFCKPAPELVDVFSAAPGLTSASGIMLCAPDFLLNPLRSFVQSFYGPEWSLKDALYADSEVPNPETVGLELARRRQEMETDFLLLAVDGVMLGYFQVDEIALRPATMSVAEAVSLFLRAPDQLFPTARSHCDVGRDDRYWFKAGSVARAQYAALAARDRALITFRVINWAVRGRDRFGLWDEVERVLEAARTAMSDGRLISKDVLLLMHGIRQSRDWILRRQCKSIAIPVTIIALISPMMETWNGAVSDLRYPDVRLLPHAVGEPVYVRVLSEIRRLAELRRGFPGDEREVVRRFLSRDRIG